MVSVFLRLLGFAVTSCLDVRFFEEEGVRPPASSAWDWIKVIGLYVSGLDDQIDVEWDE